MGKGSRRACSSSALSASRKDVIYDGPVWSKGSEKVKAELMRVMIDVR
jgi:hypothetical protein